MVFHLNLLDVTFFGLLCGLSVARLMWPERRHLWLVLAAGAIAVGLGSPKTLGLISTIVVGFVYPLHRLNKVAHDRHWDAWVSASVIPLGLVVLVSLLIVFKVYTEFNVSQLGGSWMRQEIVGLVGFSYFVFRAISILRMNALLNVVEKSPWMMLGYALFPPTITSGPIQKYQDFRSQVRSPTPLTRDVFCAAAYRITRGYFRKIVLATLLMSLTNALLAGPSLTVWASVLTIIALYLYFYFDFAGYSDIAIGFGLLLGIKVPENFKTPFLATTVSEFWRNWHITLVDWMREHVYIPLGGMRASRKRAAALAFLVMLLCGLWHGIAVTFIAWGAWHGLWLAFEALLGSGPIPPPRRHGPKYWGRVFATNAIVAIPSILFVPDVHAILRILQGLTNLTARR